MNITSVEAEIGAKIIAAEIGLRVLTWDADSLSPPAVLFELPEEYQYDLTYGRGSDEFTLPIVVLVGKADARTARKALTQYLDGSGPKSLKSIVDSTNANTYTACDTVKIQRAQDIGPYMVGRVIYLGATLTTRITGPGG
jgi:hypothetical protein